MKIQCDGRQQYQLDAVNMILDLFGGQPLAQGSSRSASELIPASS